MWASPVKKNCGAWDVLWVSHPRVIFTYCMHNRRYPTLVSMIPRYQYPSINDTQNRVSMMPQTEYQWYQYPSINDTQNRVSMIPRTEYQWYPKPSINDTQIPISKSRQYPEPSINDTLIPVSKYQRYPEPSINDTVIPVSKYQRYPEPSINHSPNKQQQTNRFTLNFFSQTIKHGQIVSPSTFDKSMKHGQIVSPSTFIAKPSSTDKSFHPELLKTKNPYFNKCPKTIVLAFKKHQFRTLVKNTIFRATDPKTLQEKTPYRIKNWICPVICILTVWSKEWTKTFLTKWRKHYTNPATLKIHQPQHPQDGNPTELTTRNH